MDTSDSDSDSSSSAASTSSSGSNISQKAVISEKPQNISIPAAEGLVNVLNGDITDITINSSMKIDEPIPTKLIEFDCKSQDITEDSSTVQKFSSRLKENEGLENGNAFKEKDYEECALKAMHEKHDNTEIGFSSAMQLAEKERVTETAEGGKKCEYTVGSDEQYKTQASSTSKEGDTVIQTNRSSDGNYAKSCSKIEEQLPGTQITAGGEVAEGGAGGHRITETSKDDISHSEEISNKIEGPGMQSYSKGTLEEHSTDQQSNTAETTATGSSIVSSTSKRESSKTESFKMERSSTTSGDAVGDANKSSTDLGRLGEIKLSTKISSDDNDLLAGLDKFASSNCGDAADSAGLSIAKQVEGLSSHSKYDQTFQKDSSSSVGSLYNRQQHLHMSTDATPSDNMSVSSMSSAHEPNDVKMSSASSSECAFSASKMDIGEDRYSKDRKYDRRSIDDIVKRTLGETESNNSRKGRYKVDMGGEDDFAGASGLEKYNEEKESLLERRLASLGRETGKKDLYSPEEQYDKRGLYADEQYMEQYEETCYHKRSRGRGRRGSGDLDFQQLPRSNRYGSRGSFEYEDENNQDYGYGGGRGRFSRQNYIDDDDVFASRLPPQPFFRDEEFEPERRPETDDYVKEKTASIRGMVDRQTTVLQNLKKASESFDELSSEIKNIRQAFIENQARRSMLFSDDYDPDDQQKNTRKQQAKYRQLSLQELERREHSELDFDDEPRYGAKGRGKSAYSQDDYGSYSDIAPQRGRQVGQYGAKDDYNYSSGHARKGADRDYGNEEGPRSLGSLRDYGTDEGPRSFGALASTKKSYYSKEDYSATYTSGADAYNRKLRGLSGRSKSLYDEASGMDNGGYGADEGIGRRKMAQRTMYDPLSDDTGREPYVPGSYSGTAGYTRQGSATDSTTSYDSGSRSSYASRFMSSSAMAGGSTRSSTKPHLSRSRTLSDYSFDRSSSPTQSTGSGGSAGQGGFQSRFLNKVRQQSGDDFSSVSSGSSKSRDKPFKSRFLRSSFDMGDSDYSSSYSRSSRVSSDVSSRRSFSSDTVKSSGASAASADTNAAAASSSKEE